MLPLIFSGTIATCHFTIAQGSGHDETDERVLDLAKQLEHGSLQERRDAAWAFAEIGSAAASAVPILAQATSDRDAQVANGALQALARIGPDAESAVPAIVKQLKNRRPQRRYRAAYALGCTARSDDPRLINGLRDRSSEVRASTAVAIRWMGDRAQPLTTELIKLLNDQETEVVESSMQSLRALGAIAVPALIDALANTDEAIQKNAAMTLGLLGIDARPAKERLLELAVDDRPAVRAAAVGALGSVAATDPIAQETVVRSISDESDEVVSAAIHSVITMGPRAISALPKLIDQLEGPAATAELAAVALAGFGDEALVAVPNLLAMLTDDDRSVVVNTISSLGASAIPTVLDSVSSDIISIDQAALIIGRMGPTSSTPLIAALSSDRETDRAVAAQAISQVRRRSDTTERLVALLEDSSSRVRSAAAHGLANLGPLARPAQLPLTKAARDACSSVRAQSIGALVRLGVEEAEILPLLQMGLSDSNVIVRRQSVAAMQQLDHLNTDALDSLTASLRDVDPLVRRQSAETLAANADAAQKASSLLVELLNDRDATVALASATALGNVRSLSAASIDALIPFLEAPSTDFQIAVIRALRAGGESAGKAEERLRSLTSHASTDVRIAAIQTLAAITPDEQKRLSTLLAGLDDNDWAVQRAVIVDVGRMKGKAVSAVPILLDLMATPTLSDDVGRALRRIGTVPSEAVPKLVEILENPRSGGRRIRVALHLLRNAGPEAKSTLPVLRRRRDEVDRGFRSSFDDAIQDIEED